MRSRVAFSNSSSSSFLFHVVRHRGNTRRGGQVSNMILGWRTAPFAHFLIPNRAPHGLAQKMLVR